MSMAAMEAPQITCTVETLCAMGVEEFLLIGLCGGVRGKEFRWDDAAPREDLE